MASSTIDHMVALIVFIAAIVLFIGLFNGTIQTAVAYQNHRATATKASDLLDMMLLSPGVPTNWGQSGIAPSVFGLQDPEFTQYVLNPFSLARLCPSSGTSAYYPKANNCTGMYYGNLSMDSGGYLLTPYDIMHNYSTAAKLLGVNGTYGFQLTFAPIVTVTVNQVQTNPLTFSINVDGKGASLADATVNCFLLVVSLNGGNTPGYITRTNTNTTDSSGTTSVQFTEFTSSNLSYVLIAYAHLSGLTGIGYHVNAVSQSPSIVPFVEDLSQGKIILAHSYDVNNFNVGFYNSTVSYNSTMIILTDDHNLRELPFQNAFGSVTNGLGYPYGEVAIPNYNPGILIIAYNSSATDSGVVIMPWGLGSLGCTLSFGGDPSTQEWVATDIRQVVVGSISYQAKIAVWSYQGIQVTD